MTAQQSDLTAIGYNLTCATTQDAINSTMEYYVSTLAGTIDWYNVYNRNTQSTVTMTSEQFAQTCPVNPLTVPDGTTAPSSGGSGLDQDQQNLVALYQAGFEYGIFAVTGIDNSWTTIPNIVELALLGTAVTYNMYFATMQVVQIQEKYGTLKMVNCVQPSDEPWIFSYQANLALADVTGEPGTPPPQDDLFSVQQLYLDLNTVINGTIPSISGVSPECMTFVTTYVDAYVKSIPAGQSTISYTQIYVPNDNPPPSLSVTSLQHAVVPDSTNPGLSTLNYLCMSDDNSPPAIITYPQWTWVEPGNSASGVMAVERAVFFDYLLNIFNTNFDNLSAETTAVAHWQDNGFDKCKQKGVDFSYVLPAPDAATWKMNSDKTSDVIATASYSHKSGNQHTFSGLCNIADGSISCYWKYDLTGNLSYSNDTDGTAHILLNLKINSPVHVHFCGKTHDADSFNINVKIDYTISVSEDGELIVTAETTNDNYSEKISDVSTSCGKVDTDPCNKMSKELHDNLSDHLKSYENAVLDALQGATAWYFPGSSTFAFRNVVFSDNGDLTVELLYDAPSAGGSGNPGTAGESVTVSA